MGLKIAVLESVKPREQRIPIHTRHFSEIKMSKKGDRIFFQHDYAHDFLLDHKINPNSELLYEKRDDLLKTADIIFLLKPIASDLLKMKAGATLIGWCHAVQSVDIANIAREMSLTLIAIENMYRTINGRQQHLFYKNNFIAGCLGINHALSVVPNKYSKKSKIAILTYGTVGQGAVKKLLALGYKSISVYSRRKKNSLEDIHHEVDYQLVVSRLSKLYTPNGRELKEALRKSDIIINCIKQDVLNPIQFLNQSDLDLMENKLIIDLSCDGKMGFEFGCITSLDEPVLNLKNNNYYYAVDHVPTLAWQDISIDISEKIIPILNDFMSDEHDKDILNMLSNATEIHKGQIVNSTIIKYQSRHHAKCDEEKIA